MKRLELLTIFSLLFPTSVLSFSNKRSVSDVKSFVLCSIFTQGTGLVLTRRPREMARAMNSKKHISLNPAIKNYSELIEDAKQCTMRNKGTMAKDTKVCMVTF